MDYEKCWKRLLEKLYTKQKEALSTNDGWTIAMTAETIIKMMGNIEREVQGNDKELLNELLTEKTEIELKIKKLKDFINNYYIYGNCAINCPIILLEAQLYYMEIYLTIIELRISFTEGTK